MPSFTHDTLKHFRHCATTGPGREAGLGPALAPQAHAIGQFLAYAPQARAWLASAGVEAGLLQLRQRLESSGAKLGLAVAERHASEVSRARASASRWVGLTFCPGPATGAPGPGEVDVLLRCTAGWPADAQLVLEAYAPAAQSLPRRGPHLLASLVLSRLAATWSQMTAEDRQASLAHWQAQWSGEQGGAADPFGAQLDRFVALAAAAARSDAVAMPLACGTPAASSASSLGRVSLTGADDAVDIGELAALSQEYAGRVDLEWALLYVPGKEGQPRNPTQAWRQRFFAAMGRGDGAGRSGAPGTPATAVHLCGRTAFEELLAGRLPAELLLADRLQLNVNARAADFTVEQAVAIYRQALGCGPALILQYHERSAAAIDRFLAELPEARRAGVGVLLDASQGRGVAPAGWTVPAGLERVACGFAGGIGPHNVAGVIGDIEAVHARPYWIDMETGLRGQDNRFNLARVRGVLEAVARLAPAAPQAA